MISEIGKNTAILTSFSEIENYIEENKYMILSAILTSFSEIIIGPMIPIEQKNATAILTSFSEMLLNFYEKS